MAFQRPKCLDENYAKLEYPDIWETIDALKPMAESKPDYEAIVEKLKEVFEAQLGDDTRWRQGEVEDLLDDLIAKHTPQKERR